MKRNIVWLVTSLLVLFSLVLVSCGTTATPTATQPAAAPTEPPPPSGEKAKVVIFIGMGTGTDPDQIAAQEALAQKFNSTHDDIEVEFLIVPHEESGERFLAMLSGGNAPQLVGPNGVSTVAEYLDVWADVTPFIEEDKYDTSDFYGAAATLNKYPTKDTGLPLGLYPSFIFYNKDMFDAAGLDYPTHDYNDKSWTYDKLREYAMKLTLDENGNDATAPDFDPEKIVQWGFDDSWSDMRGLLTRWDAAGKGRPTTDDYRTATANSPEWVAGLQWFSDGIWIDHFIPDSISQEAIGSAAPDPFGSNQIAMFYSHTWFMAEGLVDLPFEYDLGTAPFNSKGTRISRIHADNFTIPDAAANKEAAWEVMKWLVAPEQIVDVCIIYGCVPARKSVSDAYLALLKEKYPGLDYDVIFNAIDYLDNPNHESWVPDWTKVGDTLNNALSILYAGDNKNAQEILDQANAEVQKILDEYWQNQ
mgnify:CR=1 FL=1